MRKALKEVVLLTGGAVVGIALFLLSSLHQYYLGYATEVAYGYPFIWRSWASASPLSVDMSALYEDFVFWLVVSVAVLLVLFQTALPYTWRKLKASRSRTSVVPTSKNTIQSPGANA
jgi:hypothetical protein